MASYNKVGGTYASENPLPDPNAQGRMGYDGVVVSTGRRPFHRSAANAGLDLEMPGPAKWFGDKLAGRRPSGEVSENTDRRRRRRLGG